MLFMENSSTLPIYGLVLTGGKSSRMGTDKGELVYHDKPQREYIADLMTEYCKKVFISIKSKQDFITNYSVLADKYDLKSPLNAILSAFDEYPNAYWLVVACDMPLITAETIERLIQNINPKKIATTYSNHQDKLPEPLITVYHPIAHSLLKRFHENGQKSPRRFLMSNDIVLIESKNELELFNANSPEEMNKIISIIMLNDEF